MTGKAGGDRGQGTAEFLVAVSVLLFLSFSALQVFRNAWSAILCAHTSFEDTSAARFLGHPSIRTQIRRSRGKTSGFTRCGAHQFKFVIPDLEGLP